MTTQFDNLTAPDALRGMRAWLLWKSAPHPEKPNKRRKVPRYAGTGAFRGAHGTPEDRAQLVTFDEAKAALLKGGYDGVGFATLPEFGVCIFDFDDCINGQIEPFVEELGISTYAEYSPSRTGVHVITMGNLPDSKDFAAGSKFGVEVFHTKGFVTFTGEVLPSCELNDTENHIAAIPPELAELVEERRKARVGADASRGAGSEGDQFARVIALGSVTKETLADIRSALLGGIPDDVIDSYGPWIQIGEALASLKETDFAGEACDLWHEVSARSGKYDVDFADTKWDSFSPSRITFKSIFQMAQAHGWANPRGAQALKTGSPEAYADLVDWTDTGNCNLLVKLTDGNLRYVPERRLWLRWTEGRWVADAFASHAHAAAQQVAQHYHQQGADLKRQAADESLPEAECKRIKKVCDGIEKWATQCRNKGRVDAMLDFMAKDGRVTVPAADLDRDPWLLGVGNGVVDLKTGHLRDAARDEFVTQRSPVMFDPSAEAPRWRKFIEEITGRPLPVQHDGGGRVLPESVGQYEPRPALADYLQRVLGYTITGAVMEQKMFFFIGAGCNGKSVALDLIKEILGGYCSSIPPEALMATRHDADSERPSPVAASLAGCRLAVSSESREGQRLDVALIKRHTGGGFLTARLMRENSFTFPISHKLILQTNSKPALDHLDDAIRGRLHLIPFDRIWNRPGHPEHSPELPDGDKHLMDSLRAEAPGILAWLVEGCVRYREQGLEPPAEVVRMTRSYLSEQDPVSRWLEGYAPCDPKRGTLASDLFQQFQAWHRDDDLGPGHAPSNLKQFGKELGDRHVPKSKTSTGCHYGIAPITGSEP